MKSHSKELSINPDLKEPSSSSSSTCSSDHLDHTNPESSTAQSSTTRSFFNAIKQGFRRSRSPSPAARSNTSRATTPTPATPPSPRPNTPSPHSQATVVSNENMYTRAQRSSSSYTASSVASSLTATSSEDCPAQVTKRSSTSQSDFDRMSYGRHSSEWLFGNASISGALKKVVGKKRDASPT